MSELAEQISEAIDGTTNNEDTIDRVIGASVWDHAGKPYYWEGVPTCPDCYEAGIVRLETSPRLVCLCDVHKVSQEALLARIKALEDVLQGFMEPMRRYTKHTTWLKGDEDMLIEAYRKARAVLEGEGKLAEK